MRSIRLHGSIVVIVATCLIGASTLVARGGRDRAPRPKEVTLAGTITDLHSYVTDESRPARNVQRLIRGGIPAILDTKAGPVLLGGASKQYRKDLLKLVHEDVQVEGELYEKRGLRYLDVASLDLWSPDEPDHDEEVEADDELEDEAEHEPEADEVEPGAGSIEEPEPDDPS